MARTGWNREEYASSVLTYKVPDDISDDKAGVKFDKEKPDTSLLMDFGPALTAVAEVASFGAKKYTRGGWKTVPEAEQRYTAALFRHLLAETSEEMDGESGYLHAAHVAWNALARLNFILKRCSEENKEK